MSLTLNDLRVPCPITTLDQADHKNCDGGWVPATFDDLVEVAESLGGEVVESYQAGFSVDERTLLEVIAPGRYLVVPIPEREAPGIGLHNKGAQDEREQAGYG